MVPPAPQVAPQGKAAAPQATQAAQAASAPAPAPAPQATPVRAPQIDTAAMAEFDNITAELSAMVLSSSS